ncbi:MAG: hypothetical protein OEY38_09325 [Gammaproteobacteria bacterium]|nr:hypothetical protein [Gammaproteobacteria bacterium]
MIHYRLLSTHSYDSFFRQLSQRLVPLLGQFQNSSISESQIFEALKEQLNYHDLDYLLSLVNQQDNDEWHAIYMSDDFLEKANECQYEYPIATQPTLAHAIFEVLTIVKDAKCNIDLISLSEIGGIDFFTSEGGVISIVKVRFTQIPTDPTNRILNTLKKVQGVSDMNRSSKYLRNLPGWSNVEIAFTNTSHVHIERECQQRLISLKSIIPKCKSALRQVTSDTTIKYSKVQELLAKMVGMDTWNNLIAREKKTLCRDKPWTLMEFKRTDDNFRSWFFNNRVEAISAFIDLTKYKMESVAASIDLSFFWAEVNVESQDIIYVVCSPEALHHEQSQWNNIDALEKSLQGNDQKRLKFLNSYCNVSRPTIGAIRSFLFDYHLLDTEVLHLDNWFVAFHKTDNQHRFLARRIIEDIGLVNEINVIIEESVFVNSRDNLSVDIYQDDGYSYMGSIDGVSLTEYNQLTSEFEKYQSVFIRPKYLFLNQIGGYRLGESQEQLLARMEEIRSTQIRLRKNPTEEDVGRLAFLRNNRPTESNHELDPEEEMMEYLEMIMDRDD